MRDLPPQAQYRQPYLEMARDAYARPSAARHRPRDRLAGSIALVAGGGAAYLVREALHLSGSGVARG